MKCLGALGIAGADEAEGPERRDPQRDEGEQDPAEQQLEIACSAPSSPYWAWTGRR